MIYFLIRPIRYKFDKIFWRESILANTVICSKCGTNNLRDHNYCTDCGEWLKSICKECKKDFSKTDEYCTDCGAPNMDTIEK
jgi:predicted amidophosphoribosyltransferase